MSEPSLALLAPLAQPAPVGWVELPPNPNAVIIAYATTPAPGCQQALAQLSLPHLQRLLQGLSPAAADGGQESDYAPPHERALARALGLPSSATPWAAWQSANVHQACAWVTPVFWQVGADQIHMHPPQQLDLDETQARQLLALLQDWLAQDGIALEYVQPLRWLARGALLDGLETAALERVVGRDVRHWSARGAQQQRVQRLLSELQMLIYQHPLHDARKAQGLAPVNAVWLHGAGRWDGVANAASAPQLVLDLQPAAISGDWAAWAQAWQRVDAQVLAPLARLAASGQPVQLTLCGESSARSWAGAKPSWGQKIRSVLRPQRLQDLGDTL